MSMFPVHISFGMESHVSKETALKPHADRYKLEQKEQSQQTYSLSANAQSTVVRTMEAEKCENRKADIQSKHKWQTSDEIKSHQSDVNPGGQQARPSRGNAHIPVELYTLLLRQNEVTTLLVQTRNSHCLPHRAIPVFDGDRLQFRSFIKAFKQCVEATTDRGECLYYLEQITMGQHRNLVRSRWLQKEIVLWSKTFFKHILKMS